MAVPSVLIVDDDLTVRRLLRVVTERCGVSADEAASGIECLDLLNRLPYDAILLDIGMPSSGEILGYLRRAAHSPAVILMTALTRWTFVGLDAAVVQFVLVKPFDPELVASLIVSTATAMHQRRMRRSRALIDVGRDVLQP